MREIKLKAWDKKNKKWLDGNEWAFDPEKSNAWYLEFGEMMDVIEDIVIIQYTGFKDKDGKEIWEGDIIKETFPRDKSDPAYDGYGDEGVVEWHENIGAWCWEYGDEWGKIDVQDVRVIGNIYENPELLKENNEKKST